MNPGKVLYGVLLSAASFVWRRVMFKTTVIAVTGSLGKTTSTRCIATVLASSFSTNVTREGRNSRPHLALTILRTRPRHKFTVIEIGTKRPGALRRAAWQFGPDAVVILNVARCHTDNYPTLELLAAEKSQLMSRLGSTGLAILNGDDPRVRAMASGCRGKVVMFGRSPEFDVWASDISSRWPARLSFIAHTGNRSHPVQTQLVGEHWLPGALASLAVALSFGMDLPTAAAAMERCEPFTARLQPLPLPLGATILRDDYIPSVDACTASLKVMKEAQARRRILSMCDVTDSPDPLEQRLEKLGRAAAESVDLAVFHGDSSEIAARGALAGGLAPDAVHNFRTQEEAGKFLKTELRAGDLLLLRATMEDHAERIYWTQFGQIGCSRVVCGYRHSCDVCPELRPRLDPTAIAPELLPVWQPGSVKPPPESFAPANR